ncbi:aspartate kinase [Pararhizobium mangrovi]|uniref:aspartate kinase n=1 Tax=Pararhizobium mangrovi TaxID=2590452 RepID=A0A506U9Y6_9HYPH|nr:aspartate kinase [Pararhizobium mangrovi]TPW31252.1 aspartate kinase [Pararhizobium mangrovi]
MTSHSVEKIGGTSMSRTEALLDNVIIGNRENADLYNRIFVVSAYGGMTDALLEHKKSGEPGVYALFASADGGWSWGDALTEVAQKMLAKNAEIFKDPTARGDADAFIRERVEGVRSCLIDLNRLCSYGHFQLEHHLLTVREMLAALGEAHSAYNTALILRHRGVNARYVDLTGWRDEEQLDLDERIRRAFADIDLSRELPIVTGYTQAQPALMQTYDRGYSEVTLSHIAVVTGASEAVIHKEFHLSSADPNIVGKDVVRVIGETNYDVADQLSNMGMEAIHPRAAKSLRQAEIPLRVKNTFEPDHPGTLIQSDLDARQPGVEMVTGLKNVFAFEFFEQDMVGVKGYDTDILDAMKRHNVWIICKTSNANAITHFCNGAMSAIERASAELAKKYPAAEIRTRKVALVSAIGRDLKGTRTTARTIEVLTEAGIEPLGLHDLMRKVDLQVIVDEQDFEKAIVAMHRGLIENAQPGEVSTSREPLEAA